MTAPKFHGVPARGLDSTPLSESFEGRFGRMFRTLPHATYDLADLKKLAMAMVAPPEPVQTDEDTVDDEENQGIDAGYTYFGQFIDHDLTFDPESSLVKENDPDGLVDFRSPRFDLDNVYGRGPDDQPYLYQSDGIRLLLGRSLTGNPHDTRSCDLPRNNPGPVDPAKPFSRPARALIGDPRNDENVIVSQLQVALLRFHNRMADLMQAENPTTTFKDVQKQVRWHYQWVVLHDFLKKIVGEDMLYSVLPHLRHNTSILKDKPNRQFFRWRNEPYIPVEFAVAAYRFGHSMVRPIYRLNTTLPVRQMIFDPIETSSLRGFREFPDSWAVDWHLFFDTKNSTQPPQGTGRVQKSYKIDTSLVNPLGHLPEQIASQIPSLAERNLLRGLRMGLPSGQSVAHYMGETPLTDAQLLVGKGTKDFQDNNKNVTLVSLSTKFKGNAPLWYYILAEARHSSFTGNDAAPFRLGPVGGRIVAEVFSGLLLGDVHSFMFLNPTWKPRADLMRNGEFKIIDLLDQALRA